jgi:leader peptidase (prepilin peptidase)/N-methyltransferase
MDVMLYGCLFIFGTLIGSFLNVLILRYDPEGKLFSLKPFGGRSHCMRCGKKLCWYELIPIFSFLCLRGKCHGCKTSISFQYPIVESMSGIIAAGVPFFLNSFFGVGDILFWGGGLPVPYYIISFLWIIVFWILLVVTVIDRRHSVIPDEANIFLSVIGLMIAGLMPYISEYILPFRTSFLEHYELMLPGTNYLIIRSIVGAIVGGLLFLIPYIISRGRGIGFGDVKLGIALGFIFGIPDILLIFMLAFVIGGIYGSYKMIRRQKGMKDAIPFGPFIALGALLTFLCGVHIISGYFSVFPI